MTTTNTTTAKHTPGPWRWMLADHESRLEGAGPTLILRAPKVRAGKITRINHADARLIAAAPAMLEALRESASMIQADYHSEWPAHGDSDVESFVVHKNLLAAIALATQETKS